ncbi:MAG: hypothetical protein C0404_02215 [Verrucomicrobia bacterium]|nr:hypothetical protein [Verrucomicrobiota bacterium]
MKCVGVVVFLLILAVMLPGCRSQRRAGAGVAPAGTVAVTPVSPQANEYAAKLDRSMTPRAVEKVLGQPSRSGLTDSNLLVYIYSLPEGAELWLGFPGFAPIAYAKLRAPDGSFKNLDLK